MKPIQWPADHRQLRKFTQRVRQPTLLGVGFDGATELHASLVLKLAASLGIETA